MLNRDLTEKQEQLSLRQEKLARLKGDLSQVRGAHSATGNELEKQSLSDVVKRLDGMNVRRPP